MATGVGALDAIFQLGRGISALPEGVRQEGASGAFKALLHPAPYETTNRARGAREDASGELKSIENIADQAQTVNDIAPAFGMIQQLRGQLEANGADANVLEQTLAPTLRKVSSRAFQLIDASDPNAPVSLSQIGLASGDKATTEAAKSLQDIFKSRQEQATSAANQGLAGARTSTETQLLPPRIQAEQALAGARSRSNANPPRDPNAPRLMDLDRLRAQITSETTDPLLHAENPNAEPRQSLLAEYNRRAVDLGKPPLRYVPGSGVQEITGPAENVANTLMGPPPGVQTAGSYGASSAPYQGPAIDESGGQQAAQQAPAQARIQIPDAFRHRAASSDPRHALTTSELVSYYQQKGLGPDAARQAARQALSELAGAPGR